MVQTPAAGTPSARVRDKKQAILTAASRVFREKGLQATGMRDIAAELGMAVGNLYYYFQDKEELLAFIQADTLQGLFELARGVRSRDLPPAAHLYLLIVGHVVLLNEKIPGSLAHFEVEAFSGRRREELQERRDAYEKVFREILEAGRESGAFRDADPKMASLAILGAINWTVKWFRPEGGKSAREIGIECAELLVRGMLAPGIAWTAPAVSGLANVP
jgi:AcrR family transcriptional regulator